MNQNLIEINENYGATIDENGNISTISKSSDEYDFEEILRRENELEKLNERYQAAQSAYSYNKSDSRNATIANVATVLGTAIATILPIGTTPVIVTLVTGGIIFGFGKTMSIGAYGTRKSRKIRTINL